MKPTHLSILLVGIFPFGACSTYETSTVITPADQPGQYRAQATIVQKRIFQAPQILTQSALAFIPEVGARASAGTGLPDNPEQVTSVQILPNREKEPQAVEVHYHVDEQPNRPALDRREWVELP